MEAGDERWPNRASHTTRSGCHLSIFCAAGVGHWFYSIDFRVLEGGVLHKGSARRLWRRLS